ncbi:MAG: tetratricopeptide repeat protein [Myxococcaceae bacterium]
MAAPGLAAGKHSTDEKKAEAEAKSIALEGKKAFDTGDFATAISRYEAAYKIKPAPGLLFNLAQSHRKLAHFDDAISYFRRYLETNPPETQAKAVEGLIGQVEDERRVALEKEKAAVEQAEREAAEKKAREEQLQRIELESKKLQVTEAEARKLQLEHALATTKVEPPPEPVTTKWWFWTGLGVIAAGAATGIAVGVATAPHPTMTSFPDINAR